MCSFQHTRAALAIVCITKPDQRRAMRGILEIQELMRALEQVILSYEPDFQASSQPGQVAVIGLVRQSRRRPR
jgi:hypothetical protein